MSATKPTVTELAAMLVAEAEQFRDRWVSAGKTVAPLWNYGTVTPSNLVIACANVGYYVGVGSAGLARGELRYVREVLAAPGVSAWQTDVGGFGAAVANLESALRVEVA